MPRYQPFAEVSLGRFLHCQFDDSLALSRDDADLGNRVHHVVKLPKNALDNVFYLYEDAESAKHGLDFGGTGFLVSVKSKAFPDKWSYTYGVTNWHVAKRAPCASIVRLNRKDGGTRIITATPDQWLSDEQRGYDIAVLPIGLDADTDRYAWADCDEAFITKDAIDKSDLGPGEDVFMVGRFVDHDGGPVNRPAVRFGHISVMPTPLLQPTGVYADSYCIDMHSRSGYSGSPVWVYRLPGFDLTQELGTGAAAKFLLSGNSLFGLLGIHYDQFPEAWPITNAEMAKSVERDGPVIKGLSGMTKVLPAWMIREVLDMPILIAHREEQDKMSARRLGLESSGESKTSSGKHWEAGAAPEDSNPSHREDFTKLLGAAVKAPKPAS